MRPTRALFGAALTLCAAIGCTPAQKQPASPASKTASRSAKEPAKTDSEPARTSWGNKAFDEGNARSETEAMRADLTREQGALPKLDRPFASAEKRFTDRN